MNERKARPELIVNLGGKKRKLSLGLWAMKLLEEEGVNSLQLQRALNGTPELTFIPLCIWAALAAEDREFEGLSKQDRRDKQKQVSIWIEDLFIAEGGDGIAEFVQKLMDNSIFAVEEPAGKKKSKKKKQTT